jgi:plastocyanin
MKVILLLVIVFILHVSAQSQRAQRAFELVRQGGVYQQGCSAFVAKTMNRAWEPANSQMGSNPTLIGSNGNYRASPGDIIGWKSNSGSGHTAVYVGRSDCKIADVRNPGATPRCLSSYGAQNVYKSSKY